MEPEKDKWINDVLQSLDGVQRVEPGPFLFAKIRHQLSAGPVPVYVSARMVWLTAASFALLLVLNWRIISESAQPRATRDDGLNTVVSEMQLYPDTNQPYDVWSGPNY